MARYALTIGAPNGGSQPPDGPGKFKRVKSVLAAFLALSAAIGVLIAAIVLGSILAVAIIVLVFLLVGIWLFSRLWHHKP
jgi:membrane protein YdbS with pleckstrin-like domain